MQCKNVYITRHGVRTTQLPKWATPRDEPPYNGPKYDLPLALMGQEQAETLAERMADIRIDYIFSSPFLRTIQTALPLARAKGIPIKLEWGIEEYLNPNWFSSAPLLPSAAERHLEYPEVDEIYQSVLIPQYPETIPDIDRRVAKTVEFLIKNYGPNILLVGHGATANRARDILCDENLDCSTNFCALHHLAWDGISWKLALLNEGTHLADKNLYV